MPKILKLFDGTRHVQFKGRKRNKKARKWMKENKKISIKIFSSGLQVIDLFFIRIKS